VLKYYNNITFQFHIRSFNSCEKKQLNTRQIIQVIIYSHQSQLTSRALVQWQRL